MSGAHLDGAGRRTDIDGLRALAVLPVVLFHIGVPGFFGGFIGVDVFFVISGYLITGIIVRELEHGKFSLVGFYRRRVLRIFPPLFVMLAVVTALAMATMLPSELIRYGQSLAATTAFVTNILFYSESGYFAPDSHAKLLLHTWSLSVEEQFYLFWPLILAALHARAAGAVRVIALAITALSFYIATTQLVSDPSAAFYLIPSRAWEMMVGALVAVLPWLTRRGRLTREVMGGAGVVAILLCVKFYNDQLPFPGAAALLPCLGTAAILAAGAQGGSLAGRLLSWRPLVVIGQLSFSLYLWHWPVIVFAQIGLLLEQSWPVRVAELVASLALAWLSWRYVEQPFLNGSRSFASKHVLGSGAVSMALGASVGLLCMFSAGLPGRYNQRQLDLAAYEHYDGDQRYRGGSCFVVSADQRYDAEHCLQRDKERPTLLFVGDSHAAHLWPGLHTLGQQWNVLQATQTGCRPVLPDARADGSRVPACRVFFRHILEQWLPAHPVDTVVLAGRWTGADLADLPAAIAAAKRGARRVLLVGPIQQYGAALPRYLVREAGGADGAARARGLVAGPFALDPAMRQLAARHGAEYVSLIDALCPQRQCRSMATATVPLQFDYGHLTSEGSAIVAELLLKAAPGGAAARPVVSAP
ncbi:MAG: acyltransferase family protein [Pseudomonadota bacterium]